MPRYLILAEGLFGGLTSKTANACIRYTPEHVAAVLDSSNVGRTAQDILGFGGPIPVVATLEQGLAAAPDALLMGIAPSGGRLPESWRAVVLVAIARGLDVWSGLHTLLNDDPELSAAAERRGVMIRDLRKPPADLTVAAGRVRHVDATVVLTVGTDCNIGKTTTQLQPRDALRGSRHRVAFAGAQPRRHATTA